LVDRDVFDRRLAKLEELLRDLRRIAPRTEEARRAFLADRGLQAQSERWLQLAAECCIDLANHVIADHGWRSPASYRESFAILRENGVIDESLAVAMAGWAGLRNVLTHLYLQVDHARIADVLANELDQLDAFAAAVARAGS
jgi:uncharacterized protein YutE (UPF0331/DUF86 family)